MHPKWLAYLFFFVIHSTLQAQYSPPPAFSDYKSPEAGQFKLYQRNYGALIGVQRGKYTFFELGAEHHWRTISLKNPRIYAVGANMEYNFRYNTLGYKATFWHKRGRINLTYGANLAYYTDFDRNRYGAGPVIGFRLLGFHLTNGYTFLAGDRKMNKVNPLYISLRYYFPIENKFKWVKTNKDGDKDDKAQEKAKRKKKRAKEKRKKRRQKEKERDKDDEKKGLSDIFK
jgi:hypothetical protein